MPAGSPKSIYIAQSDRGVCAEPEIVGFGILVHVPSGNRFRDRPLWLLARDEHLPCNAALVPARIPLHLRNDETDPSLGTEPAAALCALGHHFLLFSFFKQF
jgi:hypothetical protein